MTGRHRARVAALVGFAFLRCADAAAEAIPDKGIRDDRLRVAVYYSDQLYRLRGYVGYELDLEFEQGESFVGLGSGDLDGVSFVAQDNHLFLKPKVAQLSTNLTVLTNRRAYQLEYSVSGGRPGSVQSDLIYALRFIYPPAEGGVTVPSEWGRGQSGETERNTDYWYCGAATIRPVGASDDGVHTRLRFADRSEQPAVFVRNEDGTESLLNFSVQAGEVVVHRVAREMIVRRGKLVGLIVNRSYHGSGRRLDSGTISPQVERAIPGGRP